MTQLEIGGRFIRSGFWMLLLGMVMSFGMVLHYVANISPPLGPEFLKTITALVCMPLDIIDGRGARRRTRHDRDRRGVRDPGQDGLGRSRRGT